MNNKTPKQQHEANAKAILARRGIKSEVEVTIVKKKVKRVKKKES